MAAPASGVDPPTRPPRGNKRKKGRKLRSRAEGGRSACRGAARTRRRTRGPGNGRRGREGDEDGDGYPRGKQFLLIQRSHPHGGASLVDPLLDLSPSRSVSLPPFLSRSRVALLSLLFLSLLLTISTSASVFARANLASANKCSFALATLDSHPLYSFLSHPSPSAKDPLRRERYGSFIIRLRSQHSSPGSHCCHLCAGSEGPARAGRFTPALRTSSLAFRRATNPRTGNDWQPFRTRRGLAALYAREGLSRDESNFESRGAFLRAAKPDRSVPAVGLLTTQSARD